MFDNLFYIYSNDKRIINKLLNNYIINDIKNKNKQVDNNIIIDPYIKYNKNISTQYSISDIDICDEYEKV